MSFCLAALPRLLDSRAGTWQLLLFALSHALLSLLYLLLLVPAFHRARPIRAVDASVARLMPGRG
ncbi:MAG: hypothetical protein M3R09_09250 [Actinomycetota bacterium]|nr:hypothetical protein [Actinomycetota bacterium]